MVSLQALATTSALTDAQAAQRMAEGDESALAMVYDRYAGVMLGLAYRILGNRSDADDLLHDVFLEVWRKAKDFDPARGSLKGWLMLRIRSRAIDRFRAMKASNRQRQFATASDGCCKESERPDNYAEGALLGQAILKLTPPQQEVLRLGYFEGLTCKEMAERCHIPVGTVKSRLSAGVQRLRELLRATDGASDAPRQ